MEVGKGCDRDRRGFTRTYAPCNRDAQTTFEIVYTSPAHLELLHRTLAWARGHRLRGGSGQVPEIK
jgi:hypothetical protein